MSEENMNPLDQIENQSMKQDEKIVKTYDYRGSAVTITERPIQYVQGGVEDSESIYYKKMLGVTYSRIMAKLNRGSLVYEAGSYTASLGDVAFGRLPLGAGSMVRGMLSKSRGEEFFKPEIKGTGFVWLKETTSPLIAIELNGGRIVLEKGSFYAGFGDLKFSVASDVGVSNIAFAGTRNLLNVSIEGRGLVILEVPVKESELLKIPVRPGLPAQVDDELVIFRYGHISRKSGLASGIVGSILSKEGVIDSYEGNGYLCVAPTINLYNDLPINTAEPTDSEGRRSK